MQTNKMETVYVIAEAGVNHNGDVGMALELIREAKKAGADAVKFQTFQASNIVTQSSPKAQYQLENTASNESQYEMLKNLELDYEIFSQLATECRRLDIDFLSTPYNDSDVDLLENLNVSAYKIASAMAVEPEFLAYVAATNNKIILSTGMCTLAEVDQAVQLLRAQDCNDFVLLQCTTNYPAPIEEVNLLAMQSMGQVFKTPYGFSDHTQGNTSAIVAVALGATLIEKHFTLDKSLPGPDHSSSCDPVELTEYVKAIRQASLSLGSGIKKPSPSELINRPRMRRGLVAAQDLSAGCVLEKQHIAYKRPVTGLKPSQIELILGRTLKQDVRADEELKLENFICPDLQLS